MPTTAKAQPAEPILAQSLLQEPNNSLSAVHTDSELPSDPPKPTRDPSTNWDLNFDIEKGLLASLSPNGNDVFRSGMVIGFSRIRGRSPDGDEDEFVGGLPRLLLTKWLLRSQINTQPSIPPKAYIVHPPNNTIFSPAKLLSSLQSHSSSLDRNKAISLLDSVQLFPVFDFSAAVDAIHEVSDQLHALWTSEAQQQQEQQQGGQEQQPQTVLMIAGLDTLTEAVIRSSNAVRGTAVLTSAMRTLTQLSRMHRSSLSIVLVNTAGVGPTPYAIAQSQIQSQSQAQNQTQNHNQTQRDFETQNRDDGPHSMFSVTDTPLFPSLLMRTLDLGIDSHLLVSRSDMNISVSGGVRRATVVEVIKDRVGTGLGRWCVWNG